MRQTTKVDTTHLPDVDRNALAIAACAALLEHSWSCAKEEKSPDKIREELNELARNFPEAGRQALERFDGLLARTAELTAGTPPAWLKTILGDSTTSLLGVRVLPSAIILSIPDDEFQFLYPGSAGITLHRRNLPADLKGRVIMMPHPPCEGHENILCHEIVHTLDHRSRADVFIGRKEMFEISKATQPDVVMEHLGIMGIYPKRVARSEIIAYDGSGEAAPNLEPYGIRHARKELDLIFRGLAVNPYLPRETKRELYARATSSFRGFVLDTMALRASFNERIDAVGAAVAVAEAILETHPAPNYEALGIKSREITAKLRAMLDRVENDSSWREWSTDDWKEIRSTLKLTPCPQAFPLIVEVIERSCQEYLLSDMLASAHAAIELFPECIRSIDQEKFMARLTGLSERQEARFKDVAVTAKSMLEQSANGHLFGIPFDGKLKTPHEEIGDALTSPSYPNELITLLTQTYANRDPVWDTLQIGLISVRLKNMGANDRVNLFLAIAEHSSNDFDMVSAIGWLRFHAKYKDLGDEHLPILRRVLAACPIEPSSLSVTTTVKEDYIKDRLLLEEFLERKKA